MNLLTLSYWFQIVPPQFLFWSGMTFLIVFLLVFFAGIGIRIYTAKSALKNDKMVRRGMNRISSLMITMGLAGLEHYLFTFEQIPYFSIRFWLIVWLMVASVWAWQIYSYFKVEIPEKRKRQAERERLNKWLPKPKA